MFSALETKLILWALKLNNNWLQLFINDENPTQFQISTIQYYQDGMSHC